MGIRINFDDDIVRDVKDIQAGQLIIEILEVLEIQFERIIITPTEDENKIEGVDLKDWK